MNRRQFLLSSSAAMLGLSLPPLSFARASEEVTARGRIIAATQKQGANAALSFFDLHSFQEENYYFPMRAVHDVTIIRDNRYLVLPNIENPQAYAIRVGTMPQPVTLREHMHFMGHAIYDEVRHRIIATAADNADQRKGYFVLIDPEDFSILDLVETGGYTPHDLCLLDAQTIAVCHYNVRGYYKNMKQSTRVIMNPHDDKSLLTFHDRSTLALKKTVPAYHNAVISHIVKSNDNSLFAIGTQEAVLKDENMLKPDALNAFFNDYLQENHLQLAPQATHIAETFTLHPKEQEKKVIGMPLLPLVIHEGSEEMQPIPITPFPHRRPQSVCYIQQSNAVCMSYPYTDSIGIIKADTLESMELGKDTLGLTEIRGLTEIKGTPMVAVAGSKQGLVIVDTRNGAVTQRLDMSIGRIIHMHHLAST